MIAGIIQARMGSKRLKGKSMLDLAGKPLLLRFIERVIQSEVLDKVILATTKNSEDDCLCDVARELGIEYYRGSENDLVDRIYECAINFRVSTIVRLCADNPLIEAEEIDRIINHHLISAKRGVLYSNTHNISNNGYPDGLGAEVYDIRTFGMLWKNETDCELREHPHMWFYNNDMVETIQCPEKLRGYSHLKLDVNTQEEYEYIKKIYDKFGHNDFHFLDYAGGL